VNSNDNSEHAHPPRDPAGATTDKPTRPPGTGSVYLRGGIFWIKYSRNGRSYCESSRSAATAFGVKWTPSRRLAEKLLSRRLGEITTGTFLPPAVERITVGELVEDVFRDYRINDRKSVGDAQARWQLHLQPMFGHIRASDLCRSDGIARYIDQRRKEGASNGTINRELSLLRRAYHLGRKANSRKVREVPVFPHLKESAPRKGFLEDRQHRKLIEGASLWFRTLVDVGRTFAWRHAEVLNLRVSQVDLLGEPPTIRLDAGSTKNDDGRVVVIPASLRPLLVECMRGKRPDEPLFTRENGEPVRDFRWTWCKACVRAGVGRIYCPTCEQPVTSKKCPQCGARAKYEGLVYHDLRRTGARNLRRAGVAEGVIMKIAGWKTSHMFRRYDITDEADLAEAMKKLEAREQQLERIVPAVPVAPVARPAAAASTPGDQLHYGYSGQEPAQKVVHVAKGASIN